MSQVYTELLRVKADRTDLICYCAPGAAAEAGAHGYYASDTARVIIDGGLAVRAPSARSPRPSLSLRRHGLLSRGLLP